MNPDPRGTGLRLNISETDNAQDLALAREVAPFFRVSDRLAQEVVHDVALAVRRWRNIAQAHDISRDEQERMAPAFEHAQI